MKLKNSVAKKWRLDTPMLVPAQWQGSVEHFYHFFFGYFMPVALWLENNPVPKVAVRDCGPMNPWFDLLNTDTTIDFIPPGVMLQRTLTHLQERQVFWGWDDPTHFQRRNIEKLRSIFSSKLVLDLTPSTRADKRITVLMRKDAVDFFGKDAEVLGSGAAARSIGNLHRISDALGNPPNLEFLDTASLAPAEQIKALWKTDILIAQHGAGLSNMVWMQPGTTVVEIQPTQQPIIDSIFSNLAAACRIKHLTIKQDHAHADIDVDALSNLINRITIHNDGTIPKMPGSFPFRLLRSLPRSW